MRHLTRNITKVVLFLLSLPVIYLLVAVLLTVFPVNRDALVLNDGVEITIWSNGVHTDYILPIKSEDIDWREYFPFSHFRKVHSSVTHIAFGWGDKGFYLETPTWSELKISTAFNALFMMGSSAMHVTYIKKPKYSENGRRIFISSSQYTKLARYILNSFQTDSNNQRILIENQGYWDNDAFYEAKGSYNIYNTCNEWTGTGLRKIGIKLGIWTPFAESIFFYLSSLHDTSPESWTSQNGAR